VNFSTSLSLACQSKDNLNSGACYGSVGSWSLYRDTDGDPSIGDVFYRYSDKCTPFTFLNGYGIIEGSTEFILLNFTDGVVTEIVDCSSLPTPTETPVPTSTETPLPTSTETPLPTATTLISSITLAYNYSLGMGSLSFSGMTTNELGDATCNSLAANYQTQTYYGDTLGLGTQFTNENNIHTNQFWVTNQYYGTLQGPLWVDGSTEYIIETDVNGVVIRYEPFIVQCTPTPTPTQT